MNGPVRRLTTAEWNAATARSRLAGELFAAEFEGSDLPAADKNRLLAALRLSIGDKPESITAVCHHLFPGPEARSAMMNRLMELRYRVETTEV